MQSSIARPGILRSAIVGALALSAWLLLAAMPAAADGGPHVASANSGATTLTADGCAGCHRAHAAQGEGLLVASDGESLCLTCHGATGLGATTDVETGVQYALANDGNGQPVAGALRSGGFVAARIDSAHSSRRSYPVIAGATIETTFSSKVGVLAAGAPVTSAHLDLDGPGGVTATRVAWGNGALGSGAGPTVDLGCTGCHNPHGNGAYRILNPVPSATGAGFVGAAAPGVTVTDAALPVGVGAAGTRNYTIQDGRTLASVVTANAGATAGDYWRRFLPWDLVPTWDGLEPVSPVGMQAGDVPMYVPGGAGNLTGFKTQISLWCIGCHTRYFAGSAGATTSSGDPVFTFQHLTNRVECTQCHVAHGSNAAMGVVSGAVPYPGGAAPVSTTANSRLLKLDNRGTCQACHDPTGTIPFDGTVISH